MSGGIYPGTDTPASDSDAREKRVLHGEIINRLKSNVKQNNLRNMNSEDIRSFHSHVADYFQSARYCHIYVDNILIKVFHRLIFMHQVRRISHFRYTISVLTLSFLENTESGKG